MATGDIHGPDGRKHRFAIFHKVFPDLNVIVDDMIAEEDKTVTRLTMSGTFTGEFRSIPATS